MPPNSSRCPPSIWRFSREGKNSKWEPPPTPQLAAWNAGLELILDPGVEAIEAHVRGLLEPLWDYLSRSPYKIVSSPEPARRSGILSFTGRFAAKIYLMLNERKIFPGLRSGALRISPHFYNTAQDMEQLIGALKELETVKLEADRKGENL
jgi:selenocysteine lyase/cysteine desulfurase